MLTPQEVQDKKFKQSFMGGYDMASVDAFLESLTEDYHNLFKENAVLKNKMKVLIDKIEEYRGQEDAVRQAYLAIKQQAEQELTETRKKSQSMIDGVAREAEKLKQHLNDEIACEEKRLKCAQEQTVTFVKALKEIYSRQIDQLSMIPDMEVTETPKEKRADLIREAIKDIEQSLTQEREPEPEPEDTVDETKRFEPGVEPEDEVRDEDEDSPTATVPSDVRLYVQEKQNKEVEAFEVNFSPGALNDDLSDIWETEYDTEIPRPKFDFPNIEHQFGPDSSINAQGNRRKP